MITWVNIIRNFITMINKTTNRHYWLLDNLTKKDINYIKKRVKNFKQ